jgi:hypothetical protein
VIDVPAAGTEVRRKGPLSPEALRSALAGPLNPPRVGLVRKAAMIVVAAIVSLLPLFYLAAVAGLVAAMLWLALGAVGRSLSPALFWTVEIALGILLVCLLKPLVEPRRRVVELYPLTRDKEPLLWELVALVCDELDAPLPTRLQTECSLRLAAEARGGPGRRELVLTVGLPLMACLDIPQLAGLVTDELALHRRRSGAGVMKYVRAINGWLWRNVYEDGRFDAWLARVAQRPHFHLAKLLLPLRAARFVAQAVLFIPMFIGNTLASSLVRRAELDADIAAARLVGRDAFSALLARLGVIEFTWQGVLAELDFLHREQQLPDSLPKQLAARMLEMTPEICAALQHSVVKREDKPFDSRATDEERLAAIQSEPARGVLLCPGPVTELFADFDTTARKVTWDYYLAAYGPQRLKFALKPVSALAAH